MSEGTLCELIKRCAAHLMEVEQQIKEALIKADVIHQDETGLYVAGKRHWEHVTSTPTLTHSHVDPSRGQAALEAIGILSKFTGVSIFHNLAVNSGETLFLREQIEKADATEDKNANTNPPNHCESLVMKVVSNNNQ